MIRYTNEDGFLNKIKHAIYQRHIKTCLDINQVSHSLEVAQWLGDRNVVLINQASHILTVASLLEDRHVVWKQITLCEFVQWYGHCQPVQTAMANY